ncbi:hypothetical protein M5K25_021828 [Dendrobium thyrsiflorum]|uniref:Uncharacterized protein n=1 Tax=Dendrobium thyrsiflorum TaxID=117978 RepID=A0ABD0UAQ1_DENTH
MASRNNTAIGMTVAMISFLWLPVFRVPMPELEQEGKLVKFPQSSELPANAEVLRKAAGPTG